MLNVQKRLKLLEVRMKKRAARLFKLLTVFACLAGCGVASTEPAKPEPLTFIPTNPAAVVGKLISVAEQAFDEGSFYAETGLADAPLMGYGELGGDGNFSFSLSAEEAERMAFGLFIQLPERCHRLASDRHAKILTVGFLVYLERGDSANAATAFQASSHSAATPETYSYGGIVTALFPLDLISSTVGEFIIFRTYADRALRLEGDCTAEGQTARLAVALKKGWNFVLVRREAASRVSVKTVPGVPTQAKWFTFEPFCW